MSWYKVPADDVDPRQWRNTPDGERVSVGKYWAKSPDAMAQAGRALTRRMLGVTARHPILADSDVVVAVPGHDRTRLSFGERLAASVARGTHVPLIKVATQREFRPPAKDLPATGETALGEEFTITDNLAGMRALIVDDVFRSGEPCRLSLTRSAKRAWPGFVVWPQSARCGRSRLFKLEGPVLVFGPGNAR